METYAIPGLQQRALNNKQITLGGANPSSASEGNPASLPPLIHGHEKAKALDPYQVMMAIDQKLKSMHR
jgi:hypothetical protein